MDSEEQRKDDLTVAIGADKQKITHVISNLDNAVEFTKQAFITIRTEKKKVNDNRENSLSAKMLEVV